MCNLSQGIRDAEKTRIIMNMHRIGYATDQIVGIVEKTVEEVEAEEKEETEATEEYAETQETLPESETVEE